MTRTVALLLTFLLGATVAVRADDFGPPSEIRSANYDALRLLAHTATSHNLPASAVVVSDTVVVGEWAIASWRAGGQHGIIVVRKQLGQWWDVLQSTPADLLDMQLPPVLVAEAKAHNPDVKNANTRGLTGHGDPRCSDYCSSISPSGGSIDTVTRAATGGYLLTVRFSANSADKDEKVKRVYARMPTEGESTQSLFGDAFFFFTVEFVGAKPVTFKPGTTIDVWFPHVLDTFRHYGLTGAMSNSAFGPVRGTLADNTLHFVLPSFTAAPGDPVMFEIDGDV